MFDFLTPGSYTHVFYRSSATVDILYWNPQYLAGRRYNALTRALDLIHHVDTQRLPIYATRIRRRVPRVSISQKSFVHAVKRWSAISGVHQRRCRAASRAGGPSNVDSIDANSFVTVVRAHDVWPCAESHASLGAC